MPRTMTLLTLVSSRLPPSIRAPRRPAIVVFDPTLIRICSPCRRADRTRASSSGPVGLVARPQTAGS
jgi:hypothetical protein